MHNGGISIFQPATGEWQCSESVTEQEDERARALVCVLYEAYARCCFSLQVTEGNRGR